MKYKADYVNNYDGDTLDLMVRIWPDITMRLDNARLFGIDTPEMNSDNKKERELAEKAKHFLENEISNDKLKIEPIRKGKYGRWLIVLYANKDNINRRLVKRDLAKEYYGGKKEEWFD